MGITWYDSIWILPIIPIYLPSGVQRGNPGNMLDKKKKKKEVVIMQCAKKEQRKQKGIRDENLLYARAMYV